MSKTKNAKKLNKNIKEKPEIIEHRSKSGNECAELPDYLDVYPIDISKEEIPGIEIRFPGFSSKTEIKKGSLVLSGCESHHGLMITCYYIDYDTMFAFPLADKSKCRNTGCKYRAECGQLYNEYLQLMDSFGVDDNDS